MLCPVYLAPLWVPAALRPMYLLRKRGSDVLKPTHVLLAVDLAIMGGGTYWYGRVVRQGMGMLLCIEERDVGGREARRPRPSVCVMATGSHS